MRGIRRTPPSVRLREGFCVALVAAAIAACAGIGAPRTPATAFPTPVVTLAESSFPLEVTDDEGTVVRLADKPDRVISLTPAVTETLFAIGAGDRVVGTTDFDDYPPDAIPLPDVASYTAVDVEAIVGLEPDLVIAGGNDFNDPAAIERLRGLGVPVIVLYATGVAGVFGDIEQIGRAVGAVAGSRAVTLAIRAQFDEVGLAALHVDRPRVFYELDATTEIYGPADQSFLAEMIQLAGGEPITTGSTTAFSIPLERLVEADPEVIVLGDANYGVTPEVVGSRPGWGDMTAVKTGAIRPVNDIVVTRPGPRIGQGLRELALAIHPDLNLPAASPIPATPVPGSVPP